MFFIFLGKEGKNTSKDNADATSDGTDYSAMNGQYDESLGGVLNDGVVYEITDEKKMLMSAKTYYNNDLEKFEIPDEVTYKEKKYKVTEIQKAAFESNQFMTEIKIGKNVTSIGASAFAECSSLETVSFSKNLTDIGKEAFCDCTALKSITVPAGVKVMGESVFFGCDGLKECKLENGIEVIGASMFTNCTSLENTVGDSAFYDSGIETLKIYSKGIAPTDKLLDGADNLEKLYVPELMRSQYEDFYDIVSFEILQLKK